jgi:glycosyltransferase involved in cell wall biosynthesis
VRQTDNEQDYRPLDLIPELGLEPYVTVVNRFIANEEVHRYFQVSDGLALYYTTSVPSGVESIAYNFGIPILATALGHFPETIVPGWNGYLAEPGNIPDMAQQILRLLAEPIPAENVRANALRFSWDNYAAALTYPYTTPPSTHE